jgi:hypothetical protein
MRGESRRNRRQGRTTTTTRTRHEEAGKGVFVSESTFLGEESLTPDKLQAQNASTTADSPHRMHAATAAGVEVLATPALISPDIPLLLYICLPFL